jgi:hypothetical protein
MPARSRSDIDPQPRTIGLSAAHRNGARRGKCTLTFIDKPPDIGGLATFQSARRPRSAMAHDCSRKEHRLVRRVGA